MLAGPVPGSQSMLLMRLPENCVLSPYLTKVSQAIPTRSHDYPSIHLRIFLSKHQCLRLMYSAANLPRVPNLITYYTHPQSQSLVGRCNIVLVKNAHVTRCIPTPDYLMSCAA